MWYNYVLKTILPDVRFNNSDIKKKQQRGELTGDALSEKEKKIQLSRILPHCTFLTVL